MIRKKSRNFHRMRRQERVAKSVFGSAERPRLTVFRSLRHVYAQVIDDAEGKTICAVNTLQKEISSKINDEMSNLDAAKMVGKIIAEKAMKSGIEMVVFDRAGYKYHGKVAALADGAREAGLKF